jgi:leucyl/phenylalanyl-tRNA---protein transferase
VTDVPAPTDPPTTGWAFPDLLGVSQDDPSGMVAIGADLAPGTLLGAYRHGLFPMPVRRRELGWFSPDPRGIMPLDGLHISRSLRRSLARFEIRLDTSFVEVMQHCGDPARPHGWITPQFVAAYHALHQLGWAHSIETWRDGELVGGLYGVRIGGLFAGESMFHRVTDASKVAVVATVEWLRATNASLFDVQWTTPHLRTLGAVDVRRDNYLRQLREATG